MTRNVRIISLRIITHYIPRYTVCIVYYAGYVGRKTEGFLSGPFAADGTRGTITMQDAWRGPSRVYLRA